MSIFGVDWNMDGNIDEMDMAADLFILNELEEQSQREEQEFFGNDFGGGFDDGFGGGFDDGFGGDF